MFLWSHNCQKQNPLWIGRKECAITKICNKHQLWTQIYLLFPATTTVWTLQKRHRNKTKTCFHTPHSVSTWQRDLSAITTSTQRATPNISPFSSATEDVLSDHSDTERPLSQTCKLSKHTTCCAPDRGLRTTGNSCWQQWRHRPVFKVIG